MRSFFARYHAVPPHTTIIGGLRQSQTSRYDRRADAEYRLADVIEINGGPTVCAGEVVESEQPPEIFVHCGTVATTTGCFCPGCHTLLTKEHARQAPARP